MKYFSCKVLLYLLLCTSCDSCVSSRLALYLNNQSDRDIYVLKGGIWTSSGTSLPDIKSLELLEEIPKGVRGSLGMTGDSWKEEFEYFGIDTMYLFILDADTVKAYGWDVIQKNYNILQRYDLTYKNVDKDFILYYPPTPEMRHIKMWPPYEEARQD